MKNRQDQNKKRKMMGGEEFYELLRQHYQFEIHHLYGNYSFINWIAKNDGSFSFQFQGLNQRKSVPKAWIVAAKNAQNEGETIDRNWFNEHFEKNNYNDCRASVALWLLNNHNQLI